MIFVLDESVSRQIAEALREAGHEAICVWEEAPSVPDDEVLATANSRNALLVTADKDFGELIFRQRRAPAGVILLRLAKLSQRGRAAIVTAAIEEHGGSLGRAFTVITPGRVRIRRVV